ncbi:MAG: molybdopterin oxidoreductase family protein [Alicyclobacillus sp.]|nr:molybdopterin oxidoreductase family protein [Alicyclobacillus sp.]
MSEPAGEWHPAVCPLDCPDTCALRVRVADGRVVEVQGAPNHPVTRGHICHKVRRFPERIHHPERVLYPLRRSGPKGSGQFVRITWDEAYAEMVERFQAILATAGGEAILPYSFYGNMGILNAEGMDRRFFHRLGASRLARTICNAAGAQGYEYTMGGGYGTDPEDTVHSRLILFWGCNAVSTNMHQWLLALEARKRGAQIVVIDVHRNRTARQADWFLQIRPGTDGLLALGLMHVLIREGWVDPSFIAQHTTGFAELCAAVQPYSPELVAAGTGLRAEDVEHLARLYATCTPAFIRIGNGLQHHRYGGMAVRNISCLPALTGQWQYRGGGAIKGNSGYAAWNKQALQRPDLLPRPVRTINMNQLGEALLHAHPPILALFIYNANPAVVAPDTARVREGLLRPDLFTVVHDLFITDTARYADLLLPATSSWENLDLYKSYWHLYVQLQTPVIPPQGEAKSNFTLFKELAQRMGFTDKALQETEEEVIRQALQSTAPWLASVTWERLQAERSVKLAVDGGPPLGKLPTPSGNIELSSPRMAAAGLSPVPTYTAVTPPARFPLQLLTVPNHHFLNSTCANVAALQQAEGGRPYVDLHPDDAAARGIVSGSAVRVWNERAAIRLWARVTTDVQPGVCVCQGLWWDDAAQGRTAVNALTSPELADMGGGATFFTTFVEVEPLHRTDGGWALRDERFR